MCSSPTPRPLWRGSLALALTLLSACGDQIVEPAASLAGRNAPSFTGSGDPAPPLVTTVCKVGDPGDFDFTISRSETSLVTDGWSGTPLVGNPFTVAAGSCLDVFTGGDTSDQLWIREISLPVGVVLDSIVVQKKGDYPCAEYETFCPQKLVGTDAARVVVNYAEGYTITFYNSTVEEEPGLRIVKTADVAKEEAGNPIGFDITVFSDGPGTATAVSLEDPLPTGPGISWSISPANAQCLISANGLTCDFGDMPAGTSNSVHIVSATTAESCGVYDNTASAHAANHGEVQDDATVTVECAPPPSGIEGCTPGYWKQPHHFDSWVGYSPDQNYDAVFGVTLFGSKTTLVNALSKGGGGKYRFGRHSTAALLSASSAGVDYGMTAAAVIAAVQNAVATGDFDSASDVFEKFNERGCPLN